MWNGLHCFDERRRRRRVVKSLLPLLSIGLLFAPVALEAVPSARRSLAAPGGTSASRMQWIEVEGGAEPRAVLDALDRSGHAVAVALWPSVVLVRSRPDAGPLPAGARLAGRESGLLRAAPWLDLGEALAARSGIGAVASATPEPNGVAAFDRPDALPPFDRGPSFEGLAKGAPSLGGLPHGARWRSVSEILYGRVAISILFPESDGTIDPNRFDWTPALRDSVVRATVRGLLHWNAFAASYGVSLSFVLEVHAGLPTGYEPIDHPVGEDALWIGEALEGLVGYTSDALSMGYVVANAARARLGAQWAGLIFAVQDDTLSRGSFPDGFTAYARLGGPWFVLPIRIASGQVSLDFYVAHELGHLFYALDESPALQWACTLNSGYFDQPNTNSDFPSPTYCKQQPRQCLMKGFYDDSLCTHTARQVGWVDRDQSGILDIFETRPSVKPDSALIHTTSGSPVTVRALARETAWPNLNPYLFGSGDSISVAVLDSVEFRVDGGLWARVLCADGWCDSGEERVSLVLPGLGPGTHTLEWRAWNSNGLTGETPATTVVEVADVASSAEAGRGREVSVEFLVGPNPTSSRIRISAQGSPGRAGRIRIYDVQGREVLSRSFRMGPNGRTTLDWDGRPESGAPRASGIYFVEIRSGLYRAARRVVLLR